MGSGTGFYVDRWRELGARSIMASDLTETAVGKLESRFPGLDIARLDISDEMGGSLTERFDAISAMDVLYHIVEDQRYRRAFENLSLMLKQDGLLVFSEDFLHGERNAQAHRVSRPLAQVESAAREAGLRPIIRRPIFFLMNTPQDSHSEFLERWWSRLSYELFQDERLGALIGPLLYPIELALGRLYGEGPSTELMICRKLSESSCRQ